MLQEPFLSNQSHLHSIIDYITFLRKPKHFTFSIMKANVLNLNEMHDFVNGKSRSPPIAIILGLDVILCHFLHLITSLLVDPFTKIKENSLFQVVPSFGEGFIKPFEQGFAVYCLIWMYSLQLFFSTNPSYRPHCKNLGPPELSERRSKRS